MKSTLLAFTICFCSIPAFAQESLPEELSGSWLSPENNAWEYGFYKQFVVVDGDFWDYSRVQVKRKKTILRLKKEDKQVELIITPHGEGNIEVADPSGTKAVLSRKTVESPVYAFYEQEGFKKPIINPAAFHLSGFIDGYDPEKDDYNFVNVIYNHLLEGDQVVHLAQLDSLGRFSMNFPLVNPQEIMFKFGNSLVGFYAVPGSELMINVKKSGALLFAGRESLLNTELNDYKRKLLEILNFQINSQQVEKLDQKEYSKFRLGKMTEQLEDLKKYSAKHRSSKRFREQMEAQIRYMAADDLMRYRWLHDAKERETLSPEYMAFLEDIPLNNELGPLTHNYSAFLNEYSMYLMSTVANTTHTFSFPEVIAQAKTDGAQIALQDEEKLLHYGNLVETDTAAARKFYATDSTAIGNLIEKYGRAFGDATRNLALKHRKDPLLTAITNLPDGPGKDVLLGRTAVELIERSRQPLSEEKLAFYREKIANIDIYKEIEQNNKELRLKLTGSIPADAHILPSLKAAQDSVFEALVSPYKGKVLYIDFWAPWCGPCMGEMPASKALKKKLAGEEVVFLYLGVNCSETSWANTIKTEQIEGEHYLLSLDEYSLLRSRFRISGIPRYMLIDKEGEISDPDAPRPSSGQTLVSDIHALLQ